MFFEGDRIMAVREMILANDVEGRKRALDKIMPMQKGDFLGLFVITSYSIRYTKLYEKIELMAASYSDTCIGGMFRAMSP